MGRQVAFGARQSYSSHLIDRQISRLTGIVRRECLNAGAKMVTRKGGRLDIEASPPLRDMLLDSLDVPLSTSWRLIQKRNAMLAAGKQNSSRSWTERGHFAHLMGDGVVYAHFRECLEENRKASA